MFHSISVLYVDQITQLLKTTTCQIIDWQGLIPSPLFLLQRGSEAHPKLYDHMSREIANTIWYCKRPIPPDMHFKINVDNATESNVANIGNILYELLCDKLGVDKCNPILTNKHGLKFNLKHFHITVSFCFFSFLL